MQQQLSTNAELLRRYRQIIAMEGFFDPVLYTDFDLPGNDGWSQLNKLHTLATNESLGKAQEGNIIPLLTVLHDYIRFLKSILESNSVSTINYMAANAYLRINLEWVSVILTSPHFDMSQHGPLVRRILDNLPKLDQSGRLSAYAFDRKSINVLRQSIRLENGFSRFMLQRVYHPQAMLNEAAVDEDIKGKIGALPADRWLTDRPQILNTIPKSRYGRYCLVKDICLYNLIGHRPVDDLVESVNEVGNYDQNARRHDMEGYIRLVNLQFVLMQQHPLPADVPAFLAQYPQWFNPYTRQPFDWSAAESTRSFKPYYQRWHGSAVEHSKAVFSVIIPVQKGIIPQRTT